MTSEEYSHPDHGEMEWHTFGTDRDGENWPKEGWKCSRCGTMAPPDRADKVFDSHDCDRYKELGEGVTGAL